MRRQVVKVILNADRAEDRQILDYFLYAGEPMSRAFKRAMINYIENGDTDCRDADLLTQIRKIIHEELQNLVLTSANACLSQQASDDIGEDEVSPLDFLEQLGKMATN